MFISKLIVLLVSSPTGETRFLFLKPEHPFHSYYTKKLTLYSDMLRDLETKQPESLENKSEEETPAERFAVDPEVTKSERRKKAALFLDQMKRDRATGD